jgi:dephospho-CoA kinase
MKTIVITGGIATGKSTVCRLICELVPETVIFDCDRVVHELLTSKTIRDRLAAEFGDQILNPKGKIDRLRLGDIVFSDAAQRSHLESIIHPAVLEQCLVSQEKALNSGIVPLFVADVPLYYQSEFSIESDAVFVVAASVDEQRQRLRDRIGPEADENRIESLISAQMPVMEKAKLADKVIWNSGNIESLRRQTRIAIDALDPSHG